MPYLKKAWSQGVLSEVAWNYVQQGLQEAVSKSRKQIKERKNRSKKLRGTKKSSGIVLILSIPNFFCGALNWDQLKPRTLLAWCCWVQEYDPEVNVMPALCFLCMRYWTVTHTVSHVVPSYWSHIATMVTISYFLQPPVPRSKSCGANQIQIVAELSAGVLHSVIIERRLECKDSLNEILQLAEWCSWRAYPSTIMRASWGI